MKLVSKLLCLMCALCVLFGSVSLAEEGLLGEAAYYVPEEYLMEQAAVKGAAESREPEQATLSAAPVESPDVVSRGENSAEEEDTNPLAHENSTRGFVYRMYKTVLGRDPDESGFNYWVNKLENKTANAADIVAGFFNSNEYIARKKSSEEIITDLYHAMLNREPDAGGKQYWMERLDVGMSSDVVTSGFVASNEFTALANQYGLKPGAIRLTKARDQSYVRTAFVYRLYKDCLERNPDVNGLEYWCNKLNNGMGGAEVAGGFVFSHEYKNRLPDNDTYIEMLYRTILGRNSEAGGKAYWMNKLNYTITREKALNGFMSSNEFTSTCVRAGLKVGKKVYEPDNDREWKANVLVLSLANAERAKAGLEPLVTREDLWERVAMVRANEIRKVFDHTRPDGTVWWSAYDQAGFQYGPVGENIAIGYRTEQSVMKAWLNSAKHRENILSSVFKTLATGFIGGRAWCQSFMTEWVSEK